MRNFHLAFSDGSMTTLGENSWDEFSIEVPWGTVTGKLMCKSFSAEMFNMAMLSHPQSAYLSTQFIDTCFLWLQLRII